MLLAAISAFHEPFNGTTVFSESKCFMKGLHSLFPLVVRPVPQWSLSLVLSKLLDKPFEPMVTAECLLFCTRLLFQLL